MEAGASNPPPETAPDRTTGGVISMVDGPVTEAVAFILGLGALWLLAVLRPWRMIRWVSAVPASPPPVAWLVGMLFIAGVTLRLFFAVESIPDTADVSILADLRGAMSEVSLMGAVTMTLPCVLIVTLSSRMLSRLLGSTPRYDADPVVAAGCYAIGWQCGLVAVGFATLVGMQAADLEPMGRLSPHVNRALPWVAAFGTLWGALILAPAVARRMRAGGPGRIAASLVVSLLATTPTLVATLWTLGQSIDLRAAAQIAEARQMRGWFGELDLDVLRAELLTDPIQAGQTRLTVAYTSRSDRLLVAPRQSVLESEQLGPTLRVIESSLDWLPDRALLIEPGATRVVEYTVEPTSTPVEPADPSKNVAVQARFFRREQDGAFLAGTAPLWVPPQVVDPRLSVARAKEPTAR